MGSMTKTKSRNLGLNIEQKTRAKFVRAMMDHFKRTNGYTPEAFIERINGRDTMGRLTELGFEGNGKDLLQSASNLTGDDQFFKCLHMMDVAQAAYARKLLQTEEAIAGNLGTSVKDFRAIDWDNEELADAMEDYEE